MRAEYSRRVSRPDGYINGNENRATEHTEKVSPSVFSVTSVAPLS
jgi:hypothetical protein